MEATLKFKATMGFSLALLLMLAISILAWHSNVRETEAARWVSHTQEVVARLETLLSSVIDGETGQRGYIITGDERFLEPYLAYRRNTDREYKALIRLTADNPRQHASLVQLRPLLDTRARELAEKVAIRRSQGFPAAAKALLTGSGLATQERIRAIILDMQHTERMLLTDRAAVAESYSTATRLAIVGTGLLASGFILIALMVVRNDIARLNTAEAALRENEESLATTLHSIGDAVLATDTRGQITRLNRVAQQLTGWSLDEARGRPVDEVFRIINEETRQPAPIPVDEVLRTGKMHGLANHTVLIARDGGEHNIADSAAPILGHEGQTLGVVLVFRDVSQEHAAELALQASEARYRRFIELSPYGVFVQCEGRFTFLNREAVALLGGHMEANLLGRPVLDFLHPESQDAVRQRIQRLNSERIAVPALEEKWLRLDGSTFYGEATAVPYEHEGRPGALVLLKDVTARHEAKERLDSFFSLSLDMLCIAGADGFFKRINPAFTETLGWSAEELLSQPYANFVHPEDRDATQREVERSWATGVKTLQLENRYLCKDGSWRRLSWRSVPHEGGLLFAIARDVTHEHSIQEEIRQLNADLRRRVEERGAALDALRTKEEEIQAILDNLLDCVITIDARGVVLNANPALARNLGYQPEEVIGRNVSMLMPDPHRDNHDAYLNRYLGTGDPRIIGIGREVEGRHKDGGLVPLELNVSEFSLRGERLFLGTLRDIRERKRFITELTQARAEAEQANRAKSAFLASMSHEIRTPMNGVVGMVDVLAHTRLTEYQSDLLRTIRESANTLLGIIDDILDFSKIEAGRLEISREPVSIGDLLEGLCSSLVPVADHRGVDLDLFVSPAIPARVLSDDMRLRQLLYNLVGNAIKFSGDRPERRGRVSVRVDVVDRNPLRLEFRIADNGIGMAPRTLEGLFTPFTQAEVSTTRRFGGTGLGLAICKRLVDLLQGGIGVESTLGKGSVFAVVLPFESADTHPAPALPDISGIDCVVVDRGDINAGDVSAYLAHAGARVHPATDAGSAARIASRLAMPVVIVCGGDELGTFARRLSDAGHPNGDVRFLLIDRDGSRGMQVTGSDTVAVDGHVLRRQTLLRGVAVAAGRASPEMAPDQADEDQVYDGIAPPSIALARASGQLILVAEDDETNQRVVLQQLALLGYAAEVADNGAEALRRWRAGHYALLLTDLHMPEMDGYTLAEIIRREEAGPVRMPILALTANAIRGEANRAKAAGMDEYLTKPILLPLLQAALEKWLPRPGVPTAVAAESVPPGTVGGAPVDLAVLRRLVGDDPGVIGELLSQFLASLARMDESLRTAYTSGSLTQIGAIAHKLKSAARSVGALELGDLSARMETAAKSGETSAVATCMAEFEKTQRLVRAYIANLSDGNENIGSSN